MASIQGSVSASNVVSLDTKQTLTNKTIELDGSNLQNSLPASGSNFCLTSDAIHYQLGLKQDALSSLSQSGTTYPLLQVSHDLYVGQTSTTPSLWVGNTTDDGNPRLRLHSTSANQFIDWQGGDLKIRVDNGTSITTVATFHTGGFSIPAQIICASIVDATGNLRTAINSKQDTLTFNSPVSNNSNPSTAYQINQHLISSYQPKNNLIYTSSNDFLGVDVTPYRKFDMGANRVAFGSDKTVDANQGLYWGTEQFDYSIARENGAWGSNPYRKLAIRWSTGIRLQVDPSVPIQGNVQFSVISDNRVKHNEEPITDALETINKLRVLKYNKTNIYDPSGNVYPEDYNLSEEEMKTTKYGVECGIIAQSLLKIPELKFCVHDNGDDEYGNKAPYSVNYEGIHNILIVAVQELSQEVKTLKEQILKQ
tara:strand:+ start:1131 stop:2399 length:1269 start_codon:yes stop_codon:yes gene_type:complete